MDFQILVSERGWHHINAPGMKRIGTVTLAPGKGEWCEVKTVDHKAVLGDELFPSREAAAKALFGITLRGEDETALNLEGHQLPTTKVESTTQMGDDIMSTKQSPTTRGTNPGVVATIEKTLRKAGLNDKPVSKADIMKALTKAFPDRPEKGMENTVRFAPGYLARKGMKLKKIKGPPLRYLIVPPKAASA